MSPVIYTVGHSSREWHTFVSVLKAHAIGTVADIRSFPSSKQNPQFNRGTLEPGLQQAGIAYVWLGDLLGGFRKKGYEAYMKTPDFAEGIERLLALSRATRVAALCAEMDWTRCHRSRVSDCLTGLGHGVIHIRDAKNTEFHKVLPRQLTFEDR